MNTLLMLKFPHFRKNIVRAFKKLSDYELHKSWHNPGYRSSLWEQIFIECIDLLYNDEELLENYGLDRVGLTLYNENEGRIIFEYLEWFYNTFAEEEEDSYYINHPKWHEVLEGAAQIVAIMEENNKKYNFAQNYENWIKML